MHFQLLFTNDDDLGYFSRVHFTKKKVQHET
jgi:hypothetical protein